MDPDGRACDSRMVTEMNAAAVRLAVYIQPGASRTELAGMHDGMIKIRIAAAPIDNAANRTLIDFIARQLGIAKRKVRIVSGSTQRRKVLEIEGVTAELIAAALAGGRT
jgi:uncharacterized protein (TIGR00251 family)